MKKTLPIFLLALVFGAVSIGIFLALGFSGTVSVPGISYDTILPDEKIDDLVPKSSKELMFELSPRGNEYSVIGVSSSVSRIVIPATYGDDELPVTSVAENAFAGDRSLVSVELPSSVLEICDGAFSDCKKLKSIRLDGIAIIGERAFYGCCDLADTVLPLSLNAVGDFAFFGCTSMRRIFCEAEAKPSGWSDCWCGYTGVEVLWRESWLYIGNIPTLDPVPRS